MAEAQRPFVGKAALLATAALQRDGLGLDVAAILSVFADLHAGRLWWLASFYPTMTIMGQRHHDHDEAHTVTWGLLA